MRTAILTGILFTCIAAFSVQAQQVSVDHLTGAVQASIPLWTIKSGDISVPVSLSYSGNGFKVNDGHDDAGVGWRLNAGGAVRRELRALPDDFVGSLSGVAGDTRNGWLHYGIAKSVTNFSPTADDDLVNCGDENSDYDFMNGLGAVIDSEPDVFSFSAPGLSGQFVFGINKQPQQIPYQDLKIVVTRQASDSLITQIEITNNLGIKYTFGMGQRITRTTQISPGATASNFGRTYEFYLQPVRYFSSWNLVSIQSPSGAVINLSYSGYTEGTSARWYRELDSSNQLDSIYVIKDEYNESRIAGIGASGSWDNVSFVWTNDGTLGSVSIMDPYFKTKTYSLSYTPVRYDVYLPSRLFLRSLVEQVDCQAFPGYNFTYHGMNVDVLSAGSGSSTIPFEFSTGTDQFGYFNVNGNGIPAIYQKNSDAGTDGERFRFAPATNYTQISGNASREVDTAHVYHGSLSQITFPDGGRARIKYEPSEYHDAVTNSARYGAGVRVKSLQITSGDTRGDVYTRYRYRQAGSNASSGKWLYRPMFAFGASTVVKSPDNLAPDETIMYSRVEESTNGRGKTVYEFNLPAMYPDNTSGDFIVSSTKVARQYATPCVSIGSVKIGKYAYPFAPNTNYDFERGSPSVITDYSRAGKIVQRRAFTYQRTSLTVGSVSGIRLVRVGNAYVYSKYTMLSNVNKVLATDATRIYDQADDTKFTESTSTRTYNASQLLSLVEMTNSDGTVLSETYKYAKDYPTTGTDTQSARINGLVAANRHGTLIEQTTRSGSSVIAGSIIFFDNTFGGSRILPLRKEVLGDGTGFVASTVSGANFTRHSGYYSQMFFDEYDGVGNPTIMRDRSRRTQSSILAYNSFPVLTIANARTDETTFADFEGFTYTRSASTNGTVNADSWAGKKSVSLAAGNTVTQSVIKKGKGRYYRVSCWAKATGAVTLTITLNPASYSAASDTLKYLSGWANQWRYLEKTIDLNGFSDGANFSFTLGTSGTVLVDNVTVYPATAEVVANSYEPINGLTAGIDSRGNGSYKDFDSMGRLRFVKNRDKDLVQVIDYHYKGGNTPVNTSFFYHDTLLPSDEITTDTQVTFTAFASCNTGISYAWYIDDVPQGSTGNSLSAVFPQNRRYRVKLVTTGTTSGSSSFEQEINPNPILHVNIALATGQDDEFNCTEGAPMRLVEVELVSGYTPGSFATYRWVRKVGTGNEQTMATNSNTAYNFSLGNGLNNELICYVETRSYNSTKGTYDIVTQRVSVMVYWVPQQLC